MSVITVPSFPGEIKLTSPLTSNNYVRYVQNRLNNGFGIFCGDVDGIYGNKTYNAVKEFQSRYLPLISGGQSTNVTGVVNKDTWDAMFRGVTYLYMGKPKESSSIIQIVNMNRDLRQNQGSFNIIEPPEDIDSRFDSYVINLTTGYWMPLPVIPDTINETIGVAWNTISIPGRSSSYFSYQGTNNRSYSISLKVNHDLLSEMNGVIESANPGSDMTRLVDFMKSLAYPKYNMSRILPPMCILKLTDTLKVRGIINQVSTNYALPLKNIKRGYYKGQKRYTNYDISLTITEVPYRIQTANNMTANGGVDTFVQ